VDRVLDGQPDPEKKAWAAERTNPGPAPGPRDDKSSMTIEELRAHVRKMSAEMAKDREEISALSHHAEQAISFWSERTPDLSPCSLQALPDLSPCSLHASSTSGSPSVHRKVASPLAFSSKPTLPFLREATATEAHAEKTQAIHKAKEQALRMAREECNRVFSSGSSSGSVGLGLVTARDEWHAKQGTSVVIDVPLPQKENTSPNALQFAQSQRTEPGGQLQRPAGHAVQSYGGSINLPHSSQQPQQQQPSGRSSVGQPIVINLGFAKKHAPQKSVRQVPLQVIRAFASAFILSHLLACVLKKLPAQVLSQQQRHVNQPFPHSEKQQQQQQANANVFATYTQVHFDTQKGVVPDGFAIAKPVTVAYNTSCSNWVGSSASILHRGPRLLPKEEQEARRKQRAQQQMEADFDKENLHIKCCK